MASLVTHVGYVTLAPATGQTGAVLMHNMTQEKYVFDLSYDMLELQFDVRGYGIVVLKGTGQSWRVGNLMRRKLYQDAEGKKYIRFEEPLKMMVEKSV